MSYNTKFLATCESEVVAFHPGPSRDFRFPEPPTRTSAERLAETEASFLDRAIEHHAGRNSDMGALARSIIVQRAHVRMEASNV